MHGEIWTARDDERLRHLWVVERKSSTQIAAIMFDRTPAAILGRAKRLKMPWEGRIDGWTESQDAELTRLWTVEKLSATKIEKLLPGRSRNAIIGRVHRLGMSSASRAEATRAQQNIKTVKPRVERRPSVPRGMIRWGNVEIPKTVIPEKPLAPERPTAELVTLLDREPHQCGWPVNDGNPFLYCGALRGSHKHYCEHHACASAARGRAAA